MEREARYPEDEWDDKADYLAGAWILRHNHDYLTFLVRRVLGIDRPVRVADFGCGSGRFGAVLMAHLPAGSTYHGFDLSIELVDEARRRWPHPGIEPRFAVGSVHEAPFGSRRFDLTTAHTVLMHIPDPERAIAEIVRVTRPGGLVLTCDGNRNGSGALFHIEETAEQDTAPLRELQTMNRTIRERTGVDHNIGVKTPVLLHRAGLETDDALRPLDGTGSVAYPDLFAAGSILAHQDWVREKCGSGLSISTAYAAVKAFVERREPETRRGEGKA